MKQEIYQRQVIKKLSQLNQAQQQIKSKRNYIIINSSILTASTDEAVTGYNVYNEVLVTDNPITTTSYMITALTSSTDYNFTVKAIGNDGDLSEASNRVTVTTKPTAATNLTAQTTSSSTFLYWTVSTDEAVTGYNV
jgi:predicted S18 family serine protease